MAELQGDAAVVGLADLAAREPDEAYLRLAHVGQDALAVELQCLLGCELQALHTCHVPVRDGPADAGVGDVPHAGLHIRELAAEQALGQVGDGFEQLYVLRGHRSGGLVAAEQAAAVGQRVGEVHCLPGVGEGEARHLRGFVELLFVHEPLVQLKGELNVLRLAQDHLAAASVGAHADGAYLVAPARAFQSQWRRAPPQRAGRSAAPRGRRGPARPGPF